MKEREKKYFSIYMKKNVAEELKRRASDAGMTVGTLIERLYTERQTDNATVEPHDIESLVKKVVHSEVENIRDIFVLLIADAKMSVDVLEKEKAEAKQLKLDALKFANDFVESLNLKKEKK